MPQSVHCLHTEISSCAFFLLIWFFLKQAVLSFKHNLFIAVLVTAPPPPPPTFLLTVSHVLLQALYLIKWRIPQQWSDLSFDLFSPCMPPLYQMDDHNCPPLLFQHVHYWCLSCSHCLFLSQLVLVHHRNRTLCKETPLPNMAFLTFFLIACIEQTKMLNISVASPSLITFILR